MKKNRIFLVSILLALSAIILWNNMMSKNVNDKFEWGVRASEPFLTNFKSGNNITFGMYLINSPVKDDLRTYFLDEDKNLLVVLGHGSTGPWGRGDVPIGGDTSIRKLPEYINLTYSEDISDKIYQLNDIKLPEKKIKDIFTILNKGLMDEDGEYPTPAQYQYLEAAIAPQGWITLFAVGPGIRKEIISLQANEINPDFNEAIGYNFTKDEKLLASKNLRKELNDSYWDEIKTLKDSMLYNVLKNNDIEISSKWFKDMQIQYPWNLSITWPDIFEPWNGEYYAEYANTERFPILDDQLEADRTRTKPIPIKIVTWATHKETKLRYWVEVHTLPIPKWSAESYIPYYQDPNLIYLSKRFNYLYPNRSYETNNTFVNYDDYAKIHLDFNEDLILQKAELIKGSNTLELDGAYQYYLAPVDKRRGKYLAEDGHPRFLTEPKTKDLTNPIFADVD